MSWQVIIFQYLVNWTKVKNTHWNCKLVCKGTELSICVIDYIYFRSKKTCPTESTAHHHSDVTACASVSCSCWAWMAALPPVCGWWLEMHYLKAFYLPSMYQAMLNTNTNVSADMAHHNQHNNNNSPCLNNLQQIVTKKKCLSLHLLDISRYPCLNVWWLLRLDCARVGHDIFPAHPCTGQ